MVQKGPIFSGATRRETRHQISPHRFNMYLQPCFPAWWRGGIRGCRCGPRACMVTLAPLPLTAGLRPCLRSMVRVCHREIQTTHTAQARTAATTSKRRRPRSPLLPVQNGTHVCRIHCGGHFGGGIEATIRAPTSETPRIRRRKCSRETEELSSGGTVAMARDCAR